MGWRHVLAFSLMLLGLVPPAASPGQASPAPAFNIEARNAAVGDILARLSQTAGAPLAADTSVYDQRITLRAQAITATELQDALTELLHYNWREEGQRRIFTRNAAWDRRAEESRRLRDTRFLEGLQRIRRAMEGRNAAAFAAALATRLAREQPQLRTVIRVTPEYLSQTLLLQALDRNAVAAVARNGFGWSPLWGVPASARQTLVTFMLANLPAEVAVRFAYNLPYQSPYGPFVPVSTGLPDPRAEYHLLYGDQWIGQLLLIRVGLPDAWAAAFLPSVLVEEPDAAGLYPSPPLELDDPALVRRLNQRVDLTGLAWDEALSAFARAANLKVASDDYLRPALFPVEQEPPSLLGLTVRDAVDRLARHYGMFWWKKGNWFFFRHNHWVDETRVAVPERTMRAIGQSIASQSRLSDANLEYLAGLSDEQLMTVHLIGSTPSGQTAPLTAFDLNEIQLVQQCLAFWRTLTPDQRDIAASSGLPGYLMNTEQQTRFATLGLERGFVPSSLVPGAVFFRIRQTFRSSGTEGSPSYNGAILFELGFGPSSIRATRLALRVPAPPPATGAGTGG
ncbi:MAG: hypothetical protein HY320_15755 [Armatimonadetes bacterium]|nr:hypothetical protein [Armatimonadota bacterium]